MTMAKAGLDLDAADEAEMKLVVAKQAKGKRLSRRDLDFIRRIEKRRRKAAEGDDEYEKIKARAQIRNLKISRAARDIGAMGDPENPERKAACERDFRRFAEVYFPDTFSLPWSRDHPRVIARIEQVVLKGGLYAMAMPRGSGKTTLCETACIWAIIYGHHRFVTLIGPDKASAVEMLDSIRMEFETNDELAADFKEVVGPIWCLEGISHRAMGQISEGKRTHISSNREEMILPTIAGSPAAGSVIKVAGLTGRIRGMKYKRADGVSIRPTLVLPDDPQTDESAESPSQVEGRLRILGGAVLGLAGPGQAISALMPLTVIAPDDLADRVLDREKFPDWNGERTKMVYKFPIAEKLWAEYAEIRGESLRQHGDIRDATAFYAARREAMDAGAEVAWPERFEEDELSAIQSAMNLKIKDLVAFMSERQNEPLRPRADANQLTVAQAASRWNGRARGVVPSACTRVTGFVDLHDRLLYWMVVGWEPDGTGWVVDYGTWPDQGRRYFRMDTVERTLGREAKGAGVDGAIQAGLEKLVSRLVAREWEMSGGGLVRAARLHVDMGYKPEIGAAVQRKVGGGVVHLQRGVGIKAGNKAISQYQRRPGWQLGFNWYSPSIAGTRDHAHIVADVNYWKAWVHDHMGVAAGDVGALTVFGEGDEIHRLFAEHIAGSETWVLTSGHGREVKEFRQLPSRPDNHWLDCLVGCAVAASVEGIRMAGDAEVPARTRKRYTQEQLARR